jgi:hypothetical protein
MDSTSLIGLFHILWIVCLIVGILLLALTVLLFIRFNMRDVLYQRFGILRRKSEKDFNAQSEHKSGVLTPSGRMTTTLKKRSGRLRSGKLKSGGLNNAAQAVDPNIDEGSEGTDILDTVQELTGGMAPQADMPAPQPAPTYNVSDAFKVTEDTLVIHVPIEAVALND